ncbi:ATP-grasp domain-containing protein [Streptomyces sp. 8L]|uniref:ATP-grasp domain-containing protein n=1 Tax=Streptomyces sp. 8L TaxID=2877242 RepID=UPI001CD2908F|nr:ATP-grasp domain-containing protein [Streptomyces sp. 8L]MCA1221465.1 ATP-grasp domain-containing protein [Streptomyces sp. 8L]
MNAPDHPDRACPPHGTSAGPGGSVVLCKWQPELARELLERVRVHVVLDAYDVAHGGVEEDLLAKAATVHRVSSFDALEELATVAVSIRLQDPAVARVVSFTEFSQLGGGYLAEVLGVGAPAITSVAGRDKRLMKQLVAAAGVATAQFHSLPDPADDTAVAALAARLSFPVVVKPAAGFGTMSTVRADSPAEFRELCRSFSYEPALASRQLVVESFVEGEELHVDAYWGTNGPQFLFISRYFAPRLAVQRGECAQDGGELLAPEEHPELYAAMEPFTARVMEGLGVTETMIHLEVFRQPDGRIVFSELATRVGGGWIPGLVSQGLGRSIWTVLADLAVDGRTAPPRPVARYIGMVHLRPDAPGRIVHIPSAAEVLAVPGVVHAQVWPAVSDVLAMRHPSEWVVFAFLAADTREGLDALINELPRQLTVKTVPVEES